MCILSFCDIKCTYAKYTCTSNLSTFRQEIKPFILLNRSVGLLNFSNSHYALDCYMMF